MIHKNKTNNFEDVVSIEKKAFLNTIEKEKNKKVINIASVKTKQNGRISDHELNALFLGLVRIVKKTAMEDVSQEIKNECKMATENFRQTLIDLNKAEAELKKEKIKNIELSQKVESQKDQICKLLKELSARKLSMLEKKSRINSLKLKSFSKTKNQNNNIL